MGVATQYISPITLPSLYTFMSALHIFHEFPTTFVYFHRFLNEFGAIVLYMYLKEIKYVYMLILCWGMTLNNLQYWILFNRGFFNKFTIALFAETITKYLQIYKYLDLDISKIGLQWEFVRMSVGVPFVSSHLNLTHFYYLFCGCGTNLETDMSSYTSDLCVNLMCIFSLQLHLFPAHSRTP